MWNRVGDPLGQPDLLDEAEQMRTARSAWCD